jgi:hypothetical protein
LKVINIAKKTRERFQKPGSVHYEKNKSKLLGRTRQGLFLTMEAITQKLERGKPLRDEEIRYIKNFMSTLSVLEAKEEDVGKEEDSLPEGKLKEFVDRMWDFKNATGLTNPRSEEGLKVLKDAGLCLCDFCGEMHPTLMKCPFLSIRKEGSNQVDGGE